LSIWETDNGLYVGYTTDHLEGDPPPLREPIYYTGDRHCVLVGPNGSGKSMRIATPFMALNVGWSVACLDIKGDFRRLTEEHRRRAGNIILALDPFGKSSDGFNPIAALDLDELFPDNALELAQSIIRVEGKEPHWPQAAQEWVAALIMYVRLVLPNGGSFADVRALLGQNDENIRTMVLSPGATIKGVEHFFRYKSFKLAGMMETAARTKWDEIGIKAARFGDITPENRELHSVISTALTQTSWLDSIPVRRDLAKQPFDFGLMKERPVTVYIVLPPRRLSTHSAWVRLIFASIVQKLMREAEAGKVPVAILCDEFAALAGSSIGASGEGADGFPVISKNMSVFRQYGIKLITIWQDLAQAKRIFGDNGFETFLANSGVFQAFAPQDVVTAEYLSNRTGQTTREILQMGESRNPNPGSPMGVNITTSTSVQYIPMPPMLPQDLRNMDVGYSVVFSEKAKGTLRTYAPWPTEIPGMSHIMARHRA
jgi:type IV secretion system protein VirD4